MVMLFAPTLKAAFLALAKQGTQETQISTVMMLMNAKTKAYAVARPNAKMYQAPSNAHVSMEPPMTLLPRPVEVLLPVLPMTNALEMPYAPVGPVPAQNPT